MIFLLYPSLTHSRPLKALAMAVALWAGLVSFPALALDAPVPLDSIAERVKPCFACHGPEGKASSTGFVPRIAGKPEGYLLNQLRHFRDGLRNNDRMVQMVQNLSDTYLQEMAHYFAGLNLPYASVAPGAVTVSPTVLQRGETLAKLGDAQLGLPACVECHGSALTGRLPAIPGLLGLPRDYVVAQVGAWNTGQRHASAPDCMQKMVARLNSTDLYAVSSWLATQAVPTDPVRAKAAPAHGKPLPVRCGSAPAAKGVPDVQ